MATPALTPQNYFATTLASPATNTDTTIYLNSLPTGAEGYLEIDEGTASKEIIYFTSKGANFVTLPSVGAGRGVGGTSAVSHSTGAVVKMKLNAEWWKALQDGSAQGVNSVAAQSLSTNAITLGYAQITSNFTTTNTSPTQVTGLTASVTIPAGGRKIKITAYAGAMYNSAGVGLLGMSIWDGTVGSGTQLGASSLYYGAGTNPTTSMAQAVVTPAAGAKTYNIGFNTQNNTGTLQASATQPSFILVEAI